MKMVKKFNSFYEIMKNNDGKIGVRNSYKKVTQKRKVFSESKMKSMKIRRCML